jgi:hypothetical protein
VTPKQEDELEAMMRVVMHSLYDCGPQNVGTTDYQRLPPASDPTQIIVLHNLKWRKR